MPGALHNVRILDFTRYQQGPFATVLLSDLGAEVVKVESSDGEPGRAFGRDSSDFSAYFEAHNRGKKSITLNLRVAEAREVVRKLVPSFDVVVENFRPGAMEDMALGYEDLKALRGDIILASASAFGREGPYGQRPGYDHVAQGLSGIMSEQGGGPGHEPEAMIGGFADQVSAMLLALGISSALYSRTRTGEGQHLDVSLIGSMANLQAMPLTRFLRTGQQLGRQRYRAATYTHYRCSDGGYIAIAANTQPMFERLCDALDRPDLRSNPDFAGPFDRDRNVMPLVEIFSAEFARRPVEEWERRLTDHDVPNAPVLDYAGVAKHPQFAANGYLVDVPHPSLGTLRMPGPAIHMSGTPSAVQGPGPELGQHTEEILLAAGYSWDDIVRLKDCGAI
ncbi:MAG: CoA transferase [Dehalococcoidia bacterium]|nr:CoA transferase [Dehalococcoidia bacterium]